MTKLTGVVSIVLLAAFQSYASNGVLEFPSHGSYAEVASIAGLGGHPSMTIEAWVYYANDVDDPTNISLTNDNDAFNQQTFLIGRVGGKLKFGLWDSAGTYYELMSRTTVLAGHWMHIACTLRDSTMNIFFDGIRDTSRRFSGSMRIPSSGTLRFGKWWDFQPGWFVGEMDEIRISSIARYDTAFTPAGPFVPDSATLGLWHCDESFGGMISDASGYGRTAVLHGQAIIPGFPVARGRLLDFPTTGSYVEVPSAAGMGGHSHMTIEEWVYYANDVDDWTNISLTGSSDSTDQRVLVVGRARSRLKFGVWDTAGTYSELLSRTRILSGHWMHVACLLNDSTMQIFLNGSPDTSGRCSGTLRNPSPAILRFGKSSDAQPGWFVGKMDEIRFSSVARYESSFIPAIAFEPDSSTLGLWHCDESAGGLIFDSSGNQRTGSLNGQAAILDLPVAYGNMLNFPLGGAYAEIPSVAGLGGHSSLTIEAWVTYGSDVNDLTSISLTSDSDPVNQETFLISRAGGRLKFGVWDTAGTYGELLSRTLIQAGQMTHIACTLKDSTMTIFLNGFPDTVMHFSGPLRSPTSGTLRFGKWWDEMPGWFTGKMKEIRISRVARYNTAFIPRGSFVPDSVTLGLWHCDESLGGMIPDASGQGRVGFLYGSAEMLSPVIMRGNALNFGWGGGSSAEVPATSGLSGLAAMTIEAWVKYDDDLEDPTNISLTSDTDPLNEAAYLIGRAGGKLKFGTWDAAGTYTELLSSTNVGAGRWHHIACTLKDSTMEILLDGVPDTSRRCTSPIRSSRGTLRFGRWWWGTEGWFVGNMDEIRISGVARYDSSFVPRRTFTADSATLGLWHCDESQSGMIFDASGWQRTGFLYGQCRIATVDTGVIQGVGSDDNRVSRAFALEQNYPNPFNPSTAISYQLPAKSFVTLKVYDMLGREVATLVNGFAQAGSHSVRFDAGGLASGVYFTRLQAGRFVQVRKMLLVK